MVLCQDPAQCVPKHFNTSYPNCTFVQRRLFGGNAQNWTRVELSKEWNKEGGRKEKRKKRTKECLCVHAQALLIKWERGSERRIGKRVPRLCEINGKGN